VARNQDIPVAILAESAANEKKKRISDTLLEEVPPSNKQDKYAGNDPIINKIKLQKKHSKFIIHQLLPNILLLQCSSKSDKNNKSIKTISQK